MEKMPHQFVVVIHIFLLQGVKVAATEEREGHHRRRNTHIVAHPRTRDEHHVSVVAAPTADRLFMFMVTKIRFSTMTVSGLDTNHSTGRAVGKNWNGTHGAT